MRWLTFIVIFMTGCTPPVYQQTLYDITEFTHDSSVICEGVQSILMMENQQSFSCDNVNNDFEEVIINGDELTVLLYDSQRLDRIESFMKINESIGFQVCENSICLPLLSSIEVGGLTLNEAKQKIELAYQQQFSKAKIFINFKKLYERYVYVIGADQPKINLIGKTRLFEVLAKAKLPANANLFKSHVIRNEEILPVDLYKLIHQGDETQNIVMQNGDQIFIANAHDSTIMVTGEVPHPIVINAPYGFLSLREALVSAGDIPFTGSKNCIQIIRGSSNRPKVYCVSWKEISPFPNRSLLLIPGDIVVVSEKPLVKWNRFINQLQPSIINIQNSYSVYQSVNEIIPKK